MELLKVSDGVVVVVFVKPNSKWFQLKVEGDELVVLCRESPVKGRVNKELIKGTLEDIQEESGDCGWSHFKAEEGLDHRHQHR